MADKTKKIKTQTSDPWYVRDENDAVFGPVELSTLKNWVEDGRVSPLSRVSSDNRASWTAAVEIPALEMDCIAEIDPGSFYGPIHRKAMEELIRAGSIPAAALIYTKRGGGADDSARSAAARDAVRLAEERAAAFEAECAALRAADAKIKAARQTLQGETEELRAQAEKSAAERDALRAQAEKSAAERDALRAQNDRLAHSNGQFVAAVEELRNEIERVAAATKESCAEVHGLENTIQSLESELAVSRRSADEAQTAWREEVAALEGDLARLKIRESELQEEGQAWQREVNALRHTLREQQKLLEEREKLHLAEQREREKSSDLRMENLAIEHESSVSGIRHEYLAQIHTLQDELRGYQEEIRALRRVNEALEEQKTQVSLKLETTDRQSRKEHDVSGAELQKKERRIAELATERDELKMTNELLKEEFVRFEVQGREESRLDMAASRRLVVLKRLFAEAAALLEGADESAEEQVPADLPADHPADAASEECDAELLAFEEIEPEESPHGAKTSFRKESAPQPVRDGEVRGESVVPDESSKSSPGGGRKWPFGKGRKDVDRQALAQLEAQARNELQRLSASGDIGAIFDRKK